MKPFKTLLWVLLSCSAFLAVVLLPRVQGTNLQHNFQESSGSYWYRLDYRNRQIGSYFSESSRDSSGDYQFHTLLTFTLPGTHVTTIEQHITFASQPPHRLAHAWLRELSGTHKDLAVDVSSDTGSDEFRYTATIDRNGDHTTRTRIWQYTLQDHLALETWLRQRKPGAAQFLRTTQVDLERLSLRPLTWQLVSHSDKGYLIRNHAPFEETMYQLDPYMVPLNFTVAGLFRVYRVSSPPVIKTRESDQRSTALVSVAQPLGDPTRVSRLLLKVNDAAAASLGHAPGSILKKNTGSWTLEIKRSGKQRIRVTNVGEWRREELLYPTRHPRIQRLLRALDLQSGSAQETLERLTTFVHTQLRYDESTTPVTILEALRTGAGDCTEYADLLTTLARASGFPARTVNGLAYTPANTAVNSRPGFALHSWNEIAIDGSWHAVDPTWNETLLDATHIPFAQSPAQQLQAVAAVADMRFKVLEVEYF